MVPQESNNGFIQQFDVCFEKASNNSSECGWGSRVVMSLSEHLQGKNHNPISEFMEHFRASIPIS